MVSGYNLHRVMKLWNCNLVLISENNVNYILIAFRQLWRTQCYDMIMNIGRRYWSPSCNVWKIEFQNIHWHYSRPKTYIFFRRILSQQCFIYFSVAFCFLPPRKNIERVVLQNWIDLQTLNWYHGKERVLSSILLRACGSVWKLPYVWGAYKVKGN